MKRLFIEVDRNNDYNKSQIESGIDMCIDVSIGFDAKEKDRNKFFDKIIYDARFEKDLFEYIKEANEIYMSTSIIPIVGGTDLGSPELWNGMMKLAIANNLTGKSVYNFHIYKGICWENLNPTLLDKAFKKNFMYVVSEDYDKWEQVDVDALIKAIKKKR